MSKAEYRLSPKAIEDLRAIWDYLAPRNEKAAEALLENIHNRLTLTLDVPEARLSQAEDRGKGEDSAGTPLCHHL